MPFTHTNFSIIFISLLLVFFRVRKWPRPVCLLIANYFQPALMISRPRWTRKVAGRMRFFDMIDQYVIARKLRSSPTQPKTKVKTKKDFILAGWKWRETRRNQFGSIRVVLKKDVVTVIWLLVVCIKQPSRQGNYHYPIGYWRSSGLIKTSFFSLSLSNQRVVVFFYVQMLTETFYKMPSLHLVGMNLSRKLSWPDPSRFLFSFWSPMNWLTFLFILVVLLAVFGEIVIHFGETRWQLRAQIKKRESI